MLTVPPTTSPSLGASILTVGAVLSIVTVMLSAPILFAESTALTYIVYWLSPRFENVWVVDVPTFIHPESQVEL